MQSEQPKISSGLHLPRREMRERKEKGAKKRDHHYCGAKKENDANV